MVDSRREPDDRVGVGVGLADDRLVDVGRQLPARAADGVAHVVGGVLDVAVERELDIDRGAPVAAGRVDDIDAVDAGELVLDDARDLGFDHLRRGAGIGGVDRDDGPVDVRQFAQRQPREGDGAEGDDDEREHRRQHGAADGEIGERHRAAPTRGAAAAAVRRRSRAAPT